MKDTPVIKATDFDPAVYLANVPIAKIQQGHKYPKDRRDGVHYRYLDIITAFDIETSSHQFDKEDVASWQSWMYIWQWQFGEIVTVIGRTWIEFLEVVNAIEAHLEARSNSDYKVRLMCFIHNASYEFVYISGIWTFADNEVFATDTRDVLRFFMKQIEFRCSYRLSLYSLKAWADELHTDHSKLVGNLDYSIARFWDTPLSDAELQYCINDVICVVECVEIMLKSYGDTLYTIPFTSTGYIRRRVKQALAMWCHNGVQSMQPDLRTYDRLRAAFRGGDTHTNRHWARHIIADVWSYDRSSSYPDVIVHCKFPMSKFREEECTFKRLQFLLDNGRAVLLKIRFVNIELKNPRTGNPNIPIAKCTEPGYTQPVDCIVDNGRILSARYCELAMTDIDLEIISHQYKWDWDKTTIEWMESARYGYLPQPLRDLVIDLYRVKTSLKGVAGHEIQYAHSKGEINSCYGMMCQRLITNPILYNNGNWKPDPNFNREAEYEKVRKKAFLNYAWAVWVTSWARKRLAEGIEIAEKLYPNERRTAFVYADTDSVKATNELDFSKYNTQRIKDAKRSGAYAEDPKGNTHYMGVFECEGRYDFFEHSARSDIAQKKGENLK